MARTRPRRKGDAAERKPKKKISPLDAEGITYVDYKDVNLLRRFMSERAKIRARRVTGNDTQQQREVARAIRVAREMALLPYSVRQVTHRNKGKGRERGLDGERGDGDRGDRGDRDEFVPSDAELGPDSTLGEDELAEFAADEMSGAEESASDEEDGSDREETS